MQVRRTLYKNISRTSLSPYFAENFTVSTLFRPSVHKDDFLVEGNKFADVKMMTVVGLKGKKMHLFEDLWDCNMQFCLNIGGIAPPVAARTTHANLLFQQVAIVI